MNCLLVMKIKWSLDINTGAVERSEAARACHLAGATVVVLCLYYFYCIITNHIILTLHYMYYNIVK